MTLQNAPPGLDLERDKKFSRVNIILNDILIFYVHYHFSFVNNEFLIELQANGCHVFG